MTFTLKLFELSDDELVDVLYSLALNKALKKLKENK
jgi:hypothetical protein